MLSYRYMLMLLLVIFSMNSCEKYLDQKPNSRLAIPGTAEDFQSLLDNFNKVNADGIASAEVSADDYYVGDIDYNTVPDWQRRMYRWEKDYLFPATGNNDWTNSYDKVYISNVVLDGIKDMDEGSSAHGLINNIKGQALFIRSFSFFQLITVFSAAYDESTSGAELGIPLRMTSDLNENIQRSTLKESLQRVIADLKEAAGLLDEKPVHVLRASKPAAFALLARVYLYMRDYGQCNLYADSCLQLKRDLLSFNPPDIPNPDAKFPFNTSTLLYNNREIIFSSSMSLTPILHNSIAKIDTQLISLYKEGDNRKRVLFAPGTSDPDIYSFKGSYQGGVSQFNGIATDEVYFMRAESDAQLDRVTDAMYDLNTVLSTRWDAAFPYENLAADNKEEALRLILTERRKSLVMRGLRWFDLKRLNAGGAAITITRNIGGTAYVIVPNDLRYALSIPENIINNNPQIIQNKR